MKKVGTKMKKFFREFKTFITRGNVLDMAVGVIVGSAFTAIVTALTKNILQPIINWIIYLISGSENSLEGVYTFLVGSSADLANAIYIDWGAFLSAIINFFLIAFVLFTIVKTINKISEGGKALQKEINKNTPTRADRKEMKKLGISRFNVVAVGKFMAEKEEKEKAEKLKAEEEAKLKAEQDEKLRREQNPTAEELLKDIKALLQAQTDKK
ncbi:MAG: large conductance mechanosensitive channel protein MscL [Candidatus Borkfalkiaceae bacterium]|nr:large conductance mechanosensitive channel protein MscL [Christensenellaceae bacterium]